MDPKQVENKEKRTNLLIVIASVAIIVVAIVLAIVGYIYLPDYVVTQVGINGNNSGMPKLAAVLIAFAISVGGAVACIFIKNSEKSRTSAFILGIVGIIISVIMLAVNLA